MKRLIPDLERDLRAAARRRIAEYAAGRSANDPGPERTRASFSGERPGNLTRVGGRRGRRWRPSFGGIVAVAGVLVALVIGGGAVALLDHHGLGPAGREVPRSFGVIAPRCPDLVVGDSGRAPIRLRVAARGRVEGESWRFEIDAARSGVARLTEGRLVLGGQAYGLCQTFAQLELVRGAPNGIVFGVVQGGDARDLQLGSRPGPARARPVAGHDVAGGVVFVSELPVSACRVRTLGFAFSARSTGSATVQSVTEATYSERFKGCGSGPLVEPVGTIPTITPTSPVGPAIRPPSELTARQRALFQQGETIAGQSGCLGCHEIGTNGDDGPGPPLTDIGSTLSTAAIRRALVDPKAPMPSFKELGARRLRALIAFLRDLRTGGSR